MEKVQPRADGTIGNETEKYLYYTSPPTAELKRWKLIPLSRGRRENSLEFHVNRENAIEGQMWDFTSRKERFQIPQALLTNWEEGIKFNWNWDKEKGAMPQAREA